MIRGKVNSDREAVIKFPIFAVDGRAEEVVALIDTGFTDYLLLPLRFVENLGLPFESVEELTLADGSVVELECYRAKVDWDGQILDVIVAVAEGDPLVGMSMSDGFEIRIRNVIGGDVEIERIP